MKRFIFGTAALVLAAGAQAQAYMGASVGSSSIDIDCAASCEDSDTGFKIYGGLPIANSALPNLAIEFGYIDFGKATDRLGPAHHDIEVSALTAAAALRLKFTPALNGVGRLGVGYVDAKTTGAIGGFGGSDSSSELNLYFGVGLEYALNKQWKLTGSADFTSYDSGTDSGDANLFSVGLQYSF